MPLIKRASLAVATLGVPSAFAAYTTNMPEGVSEISRDIYFLHMTIFGICVLIGIGVFSAMFYAILRHRKSVGHVPAQFHESTTVEIIWTIIPFVILIAMAIPATKTLIHMSNTQNSDLTIKITGYQWKWHYEYMGEDVKFFSNLKTSEDEMMNRAPKSASYLYEVDNPLVLPVGKKVRFLATANDVVHSWWVPEFGVKKDAIPGFINETWVRVEKTGRYYGQCTELCGARHGFMPIVVEVKTEAAFADWLQAQKDKAVKKHAALKSHQGKARHE